MTDYREFAEQWLAAWNAHDLDGIVSHYAEDVEFCSPLVEKLLGEPAGVVRGKAALREYFARGLASYPDLHFELIAVLDGVTSTVIHYRSVRGLLAAEFCAFDSAGRVQRVHCHYAAAPSA